jgi:putative hydrolase of the HAD superfamily
MSPRFIDSFDTVLLDMNRTFAFDCDRYGPEQDYLATYRSFGGSRLTAHEVDDAISRCWEVMNRIYHDPTRFDDQPSAIGTMRELGVDEEEVAALAAAFCEHERGEVPPGHVEAILELSRTHRLGVVSNIWAPPELFREQFERAGLGAAFAFTVFSSEDRSVKPSPRIFQRALAALPEDARVLFVGDSLERDIIPAKSFGMGTVWVTSSSEGHPAADVVVDSLVGLPTLR